MPEPTGRGAGVQVEEVNGIVLLPDELDTARALLQLGQPPGQAGDDQPMTIIPAPLVYGF